MKKLEIKWQRLVSEGKTCPRCQTTGEELTKTVSNLKESLKALGIEVSLVKEELSVDDFKEAPLQSNMILFNNQTLEELIGANVGESECCDVCGSSDCRTTEVGGEIYEVVPGELILKAGLLAAAKLMDSDKQKACCGNESQAESNSSCC